MAKLLVELSNAVVGMDEARAIYLAEEVITEKYNIYQAIEQGLVDGMDRAGKLFETEKYFIPELLMCSDVMYAGLDILKPYLKVNQSAKKYKVVIGVVEGDTHDIGKNLVKIMLETAEFEIYDLGRDVPPHDFVVKAKEVNAQIIALSSLMTTGMEKMANVIQLLQQLGIREKFMVMVGGGPISQSFADQIGADGYAKDAVEAVRVAQRLVGKISFSCQWRI